MKARTLVELAAISSTIYTISKDKELLDKLNQWAQKGKEKINSFVNERVVDEDGRELDFIEKLTHRIEESRKELEERISELVKSTYERLNITHIDQITVMKEQLSDLKKEVTLLRTKLNRTEKKGQ